MTIAPDTVCPLDSTAVILIGGAHGDLFPQRMHQQFYIIIFQVHLPDACHTESNAILVKHDCRDALVTEQLEVCYLIPGQVERALPHL